MNTKIRVIIIAVVVIVTLSGLIKACATKSDYVANSTTTTPTNNLVRENTIPPEPVVNQVDDDNTDVLLGLVAGVVAGSLIDSTVSNNKQSKPESTISKSYASKNKTKTQVNKQVKSKPVSLKKNTSIKK